MVDAYGRFKSRAQPLAIVRVHAFFISV